MQDQFYFIYVIIDCSLMTLIIIIKIVRTAYIGTVKSIIYRMIQQACSWLTEGTFSGRLELYQQHMI